MKRVYVVHYHGETSSLTVSLGERSVPMDEFVQNYTPIQITSLTDLVPGAKVQAFIGLMIAEESGGSEPATS